MELQQSPPYIKYIRKLGWHTHEISRLTLIHRKILFLGGLAKLQRGDSLPDFDSLKTFIFSQKIKTLAMEPGPRVSQSDLDSFISRIRPFVRINPSPFLPTKTILVDLTGSEDEIFRKFTEAKRRAVRRAQKNRVSVYESENIDDMIRIKSKAAGLFGSITTYGLRDLRESFTKTRTAILIARVTYPGKSAYTVGGVFLVFWENTAYYWIAGATHEGKKFFAPTLLVWEAMKTAKARGARAFDFVGVWDERMPKQNREWFGFTKFKEGFGGNPLYYPVSK